MLLKISTPGSKFAACIWTNKFMAFLIYPFWMKPDIIAPHVTLFLLGISLKKSSQFLYFPTLGIKIQQRSQQHSSQKPVLLTRQCICSPWKRSLDFTNADISIVRVSMLSAALPCISLNLFTNFSISSFME